MNDKLWTTSASSKVLGFGELFYSLSFQETCDRGKVRELTF